MGPETLRMRTYGVAALGRRPGVWVVTRNALGGAGRVERVRTRRDGAMARGDAVSRLQGRVGGGQWRVSGGRYVSVMAAGHGRGRDAWAGVSGDPGMWGIWVGRTTAHVWGSGHGHGA